MPAVLVPLLHRALAPLPVLGRYALARERRTKRALVMIVDACLCALTAYAAVILRLGFWPERDTPFGLLVGISIALALPLFWAMGLYREVFSQAGLHSLTRIAASCLVYALPFASIFTVVNVWGIPRTLPLIQPVLLFVAVAAARGTARFWLGQMSVPSNTLRERVLICDTGPAGRQLAAAIGRDSALQVVGFIDDDPTLAGSVLDGVRIHHPGAIAEVARRHRVNRLLLAMPAPATFRRRAIADAALAAGLAVDTLPTLDNIAGKQIGLAHLRQFTIEDVLSRPAVAPDIDLMRQAIAGRVVLVTGAGGSIGGELCRQLLAHGPACLLLFDSGEFALYDTHRRLVQLGHAVRLVPLLGSVCDASRIDEVVGQWRPDVIYHAAAYKHVPLVEHNPAEAIRTNILGTQVVAEAAARWRVAVFVQISTDKAVRPVSVMGATKRAAELVVQAMAKTTAMAARDGPSTRFSLVRFGNVLDSSGSVVPLFREQISQGGPITITDRRMTRYFMTLAEAAALVLQASTLAQGGEVFVLDMDVPVRIIDLARKMVALAGLQAHDDPATPPPAGAIAIREIGLRPGEKLHEELLITPNVLPTLHPRIRMAIEPALSPADVTAHLDRLRGALGRAPSSHLLALLRDMVAEYSTARPVLDWVHLARQERDEAGVTVGQRAV